MEDPENGVTPRDFGATDTGNASGKPTRRGKRKRRGKGHLAATPVSENPPQVQASASGRPVETHAEKPAKRKRRRRSRNKKNDLSVQMQVESGQAVTGQPAASHGRTKNHASKDPKLRHHRRLQGRALSSKPVPSKPAARHAQAQTSPVQGQGQGGSTDLQAAVAGQSLHLSDPRPARLNDPHWKSVQASLAENGPDDLYAALDLGTNNCRLLIAQPTRPGQFRVVDAFSRIVRLGEGLAASGKLSEEAMDRSVEALKICATKLGMRKIRRVRLIATEACRQASNGEEFLTRVKLETGLDLEIISRQTEAQLAVSGCSSLVGLKTKSVVLFDIGGGSSEIAVIRIGDRRSGRLANHITHWTSLPVGVVTLSERHGGRDVTPDVFEVMVREVDDYLADFESPTVSELAIDPEADFHLIGTSGTVTTLAGVHLDLPRYDRRRVDGLWLSDAEVTTLQSKLLSWSFAERAGNACIGPDRADLVLAGCAILESIRRRWPSPRLRVADRGLREGLLTDMMSDDGIWRRSRNRKLF